MISKYAFDGRPTMLYADLACSESLVYLFVKLSQYSLHKHDVMFLYVVFEDVIVQYTLSPSKMNLFIGCVDSGTVSYITVSDIMPIPDLSQKTKYLPAYFTEGTHIRYSEGF